MKRLIRVLKVQAGSDYNIFGRSDFRIGLAEAIAPAKQAVLINDLRPTFLSEIIMFSVKNYAIFSSKVFIFGTNE